MQKEHKTSSEQLHINLPTELKKDLGAIAKKEYRSTTSLVTVILKDFVDRYKESND